MKFLVIVLALGFVLASAYPYGNMGYGFGNGMLGSGLNMMNQYGGMGVNRRRYNRRPANRYYMDDYDDNYYDDDEYYYDSYEDYEWRPMHKRRNGGAMYGRQRGHYGSDSYEPYTEASRPMYDKTSRQHSSSYNDKSYKHKKDSYKSEPYASTYKSSQDYNKYQPY
ncbi:hypothetical protein BpHYR1_023759 [Brachionus plicatilis]|uniref:Uncharacterized protein n=1 Tax=Brachionus plicatilis TaxID=10195 RepID=A0A3M7SND4_BRAPC|nr:hypothetical protein BpHYR1_023759 [Brachionus plicatilis]